MNFFHQNSIDGNDFKHLTVKIFMMITAFDIIVSHISNYLLTYFDHYKIII